MTIFWVSLTENSEITGSTGWTPAFAPTGLVVEQTHGVIMMNVKNGI